MSSLLLPGGTPDLEDRHAERRAGSAQLAQAQRGWVTGADGNPFVPADVLADLRTVNSRLGLVWLPPAREFWITLAWGPDDPRRATLRESGMGPEQIEASAFDLLDRLPRGVGPDQAAAWARRVLQRVSTNRDDVRRMLADHAIRLQAQHAARTDELRQLGTSYFEESAGEATRASASRIGQRREAVPVASSLVIASTLPATLPPPPGGARR